MFIGDGGTGKTTIALQLAAAVARGAPDWLGATIEIEPSPVIFFSGEERNRSSDFGSTKIGRKQGFDYLTLDNLYLYFAEPSESVLGVFDRRIIIRPTALFHSLEKSVLDVRPNSSLWTMWRPPTAGTNSIARRLVRTSTCFAAWPARAAPRYCCLITHTIGNEQWHWSWWLQ